MSNIIEPRLQYTYAKINVETGLCTSIQTMTYEINMAGFILVPHLTSAYRGKYYNQADGHWYVDADFTVSCPELDW